MYTILLIISYYIYNHNPITIKTACTIFCTYYYTTNVIFIIIGLSLYLVANLLFYYYTKKTLLVLFNTKVKYLILITYSIIGYLGIIFGILSFFGFMGIFVIDNIFLNLFRYIITYSLLLIYPIDILVIDKLKKNS